MNYYPALATLLDRYLATADRSGAWLAQRLGVNPATVTRWRTGETRPNSPEMVIRLADVLGLHEATARQQFLHAAGYGYLERISNTGPSVQSAEQPVDQNNASELQILPPSTGRTFDYWQKFPRHYRAREMQTLAHWIAAGISGAVVGLPGVGKSNLLSFLCQRPDALHSYLPAELETVVLVPVALTGLLENTVGALHRLFVRAFYERRQHFSPALQTMIGAAYQIVSTNHDAFLTQSALYDLLLAIEGSAMRIVLVLDRFDLACQGWTPAMRAALRSLHEQLRDRLIYILGVGRNLAELEDLALTGDLYRLLATHHCYVGPLSAADARNLIARRLALSTTLPTASEITCMLALTGGYPTLLKLVCHWWLMTPNKPPPAQWLPTLRAETTVQKRLADIWGALTPAEQQFLSALPKSPASTEHDATTPCQPDRAGLTTLLDKGLCFQEGENIRIFSGLFADYVAKIGA